MPRLATVPSWRPASALSAARWLRPQALDDRVLNAGLATPRTSPAAGREPAWKTPGKDTLGAEATSPPDLASAYATLAATGTHCDPTPVTGILDSAGRPLTDEHGRPVVSEDGCQPNRPVAAARHRRR